MALRLAPAAEINLTHDEGKSLFVRNGVAALL
jgi:hypothetical protein